MEKSYRPGETVLMKGELSHNFFIIVRGKIKFELNKKPFFLSDGDFFGEEGVFFNKPNPFIVTAAEETQVQMLSKDEAKNFILKNPDAVFNMFIRNCARFSEGIEPVSDINPMHIKALEQIVPHLSQYEGDFPAYLTAFSLEELAKTLQISTEELTALLQAVEPLGYLYCTPQGEIKAAGKNKISRLIKKYYSSKFFCEVKSGKGTGIFPLVNEMNKEEKKGITI
ncbi:MAG: Crp/Fnr family transcriptional regulator [bacterium]